MLELIWVVAAHVYIEQCIYSLNVQKIRLKLAIKATVQRYLRSRWYFLLLKLLIGAFWLFKLNFMFHNLHFPAS